MTYTWPSIDMHAHIDVDIDPGELLNLRAVIFAANRSLEESRRALLRQDRDQLSVWGVGVHPAVPSALAAFDVAEFLELVKSSAYVSEVGLDSSRESSRQLEVFSSVLEQLQASPRLTSIHSSRATAEVLERLIAIPINGAILHWWRGNREETIRAIDLGAYFSVNVASLRSRSLVDLVPLDRLLLETDHPDGNARGRGPRRPGNVSEVEEVLAASHNTTVNAIRIKCWKNLARLVDDTGTIRLLPPKVGAIITAARNS